MSCSVRTKQLSVVPKTGTVACRFERSTLKRHAGKRVLLLRVLKVVEPVRCVEPGYDGHIQQPLEGAFMCRRGIPVGINVDHKRGVDGLRMLYELDNRKS